MTTSPQAVPPADQARTPEAQVLVVSHSTLFYWWPVWAVGFILGFLTLIAPSLMVVVPKDTEKFDHADVKAQTKGEKVVTVEDRTVYVLPKEKKEKAQPEEGKVAAEVEKLGLHMTQTSQFGVLYMMVVLAVVFFTNVPLRGGWSVGLIVVGILVTVILILAGWMEPILRQLHYLDIRINAGGYIFMSLCLLILWLLIFIFYDRQIYIVFTPGQFKVCTEVGGGEQVYPAGGVSLEKRRSDLFRHWILGLGSGDLVVHAGQHHFDFPNVLNIGRKVARIEDMLKKRAVIETR
jgi:hypothetical protein